MFVGELVELPGSHGVHLEEGDAAAAPLALRVVDGEEGLEEQVDDALGDRMGVDSQAGQQVVHVAHVPKLRSGMLVICVADCTFAVWIWITLLRDAKKETQRIWYLGSADGLDLDEHVQESHAHFLRLVVKAVLEGGQEFFQQRMA